MIGPYIFPYRLTGDVHARILQEVIPELLLNVPHNMMGIMWYQHDGAPAHFSRAAQQILNNRYPNKWIGRNGPEP